MAAQSVAAFIAARARALGLDPQAVLAVARQEGLSGRVGDNGTSFGPFQLHIGGALPRGIPASQAQAWAESPAGINYALRRIASVAGGEHGAQAIQDIVSRFERPANVPREVQNAISAYGGGAGSSPALAMSKIISGKAPGNSAAAAPTNNAQFRQLLSAYLLSQAQSALSGNSTGPSSGGLLELAMARKALGAAATNPVTAPMQKRSLASAKSQPVPQASGDVNFLGDTQGVQGGFLNKVSAAAQAVGATQIKVTSGYRSPQHNAAVGGVPDSNHLTGHALDGEAFIPGKGWVPLGEAIQPVAAKFGLRSGNVPGFFNGAADPVHVDDGFNQG